MNIRVKICGITRWEDALAACDAGAWAVGFIFHPASPRFVKPEVAAEISARLPPFVLRVGVFVNEEPERINALAQVCGLDRVQLHGGEPYDTLTRLDRGGWRAISLKTEADISTAIGLPDAALLLDTHHPELKGGTGQTFDWDWAARVAAAKPVILAGGLTPQNAREAVARAAPYGLDVNSGVESSPGIKDPVKIKELFKVLKGL
ncbi:MAG: phosphoribosylanthranilate isomerase [Deltaproteobacteria bacterium]|nr:phosphoribosylanthranilate isomerase [Deltaproteobacteria bacterium]